MTGTWSSSVPPSTTLYPQPDAAAFHLLRIQFVNKKYDNIFGRHFRDLAKGQNFMC